MTFGSKNSEEDSEAKRLGILVLKSVSIFHPSSVPVVSWPNKGPSQGRLVAENKLSFLDLKMHNGTITRLYKKVFPILDSVFLTFKRAELLKNVHLAIYIPSRSSIFWLRALVSKVVVTMSPI